jgi:YD repeat-containing protein
LGVADSFFTGARYQDAQLFYDALGRLSAETDRGASISYSYDAVGNRRRVLTQTQGSTPGTVASNDRWYRYDALNRLTLANGGRVNGQIVGYGGNGNRAYVQSGSLYTLYRYTPDHQISQIYRSGSTSTSTGTLIQRRRYDAAGRVVEIDDNTYTGRSAIRVGVE